MNRIIDYENLSLKIQEWIKNYVTENGISTLVGWGRQIKLLTTSFI
jgi:hypothetical protein